MMRLLPAFAVVLLALACAQAGRREKLSFDDREAMRRNACNKAAWEKCGGERDHKDCVEREALPCDTQVENTVDPNQLPPRPEGIEDSTPAAPVEPLP
jgi:hypothetical protein